LRAALHEVPSASSVVIIVHGIAGNADAQYCLRAARSAVQAGFSAVRVSLRGADGNGDDIYHAALTDDLRVLLAAHALRRYRQVFLMGYSQGGNMVIRAASERIDPRIAGAVAICPPLDLARVMSNFDRKRFRLLKLIMNREANRQYERIERRGRAFSPVADLRACEELRGVERVGDCAAFWFSRRRPLLPSIERTADLAASYGSDAGCCVAIRSHGAGGLAGARARRRSAAPGDGLA